ncbi:FAD-binding oxidoreductase [bacterium]|nr:FAD-binding oxidoreductase [candidate division CSSED10-310 bacterium]
MERHQKRVAEIAQQVRKARATGRPLEFVKDSVSHLVPNPYKNADASPRVDLRGLDRIVMIDPDARICVAESGATFAAVVAATLARGLMPYTVPELKTITIGGAVSGCSLESMSYKHGGFHDNCLEYEVVTGTGEVVTCSPERDPELFNMLHGSYGTLGIITRITFRLLPAKPFVEMTYLRYHRFDSFWEALQQHCSRGESTFIDAIAHGADNYVLCLGAMTDHAEHHTSYDRLNIYYKSTLGLDRDCLTTFDYFFRYDTECHWLTRTFPPLENRLVRFLFGRFLLGSSNLIAWSGRLRWLLKYKRRPDVVVDVFVPARNFPSFMQWYVERFRFFPLWIVPYGVKQVYPWVNAEYAKGLGGGLMIDCAVYGRPNGDPGVDYSELLERKVTELNGMKTLISRNHYDEETFWRIYNREAIAAIKQRVDPRNLFGGLYERFAPHHYQAAKHRSGDQPPLT